MQLNWCRTDAGYSPGLLPKFQFVCTHSFTWAERGDLPKNKTLEPRPLDPKDTRRNIADCVAFSFGNWSSWSMINLIMLHERNRYIYYGQGLVGFLGAPSSEWSENINPYPNLPKEAHPKFYFKRALGFSENKRVICLSRIQFSTHGIICFLF